jgi:hypothetical protein
MNLHLLVYHISIKRSFIHGHGTHKVGISNFTAAVFYTLGNNDMPYRPTGFYTT